MKKIKGEGRTRLGRFAAITIPATVVTAGLGYAVLQGMVSATVASADGFDMTSSHLTANGLAVRPGVAGSGGNTVSSAVADVQGAKAADLGLTVSKSLPLVTAITGKEVQLTVALGSSSTTGFDLNNVVLNAADLKTGVGSTTDSSIANVNVGTTQAGNFTDTGASDADSGYDANGFALTGGATVLNGLDAKAYGATLPNGLNGLSNLHISAALVSAGS